MALWKSFEQSLPHSKFQSHLPNMTWSNKDDSDFKNLKISEIVIENERFYSSLFQWGKSNIMLKQIFNVAHFSFNNKNRATISIPVGEVQLFAWCSQAGSLCVNMHHKL